MKYSQILEACWKGYHREGNKKMFGKTYPNCVKNKAKNEGIDDADMTEAGRVARKAGQPANSKKHSDLYTDENPRGTITGLKFATVEDARASVTKIRNSGRSHAHKIQAAVAMEQRARAAGKASAAAVYRRYINANKKTDEQQLAEKCWDGYSQQGTKNKGGRQVPNCVRVSEDHSPDHNTAANLAQDLASIMANVEEIKNAGPGSTNSKYLQELQRNIDMLHKQIRRLGYKYDPQQSDLIRPLGRPIAEIKIGTDMPMTEILYKAAAQAIQDAGREGIDLDYETAIKQASKLYGISYQPSELPRLQAQRAEIDRQLALLKQGRQVARQRRAALKAPTPAGTDEYWQTNALPTGRIKPAAKSLEEQEQTLAEDLKQWFKQKWVRFGPDGKIRGACARGKSSEGKSKCLPQAKAHALGKKGRAKAGARKRRKDPDANRSGRAINVKTKEDVMTATHIPRRPNAIAQGMRQANPPRMQESLKAGEYYIAQVTLDTGEVKRVKVTSDEGYDDAIRRHYAAKGRQVVDIDMDFDIQNPVMAEDREQKINCARTKSAVCQCESVNKIMEDRQTLTAICVLEHGDDVQGTILLKQQPGLPTFIAGEITGLQPGQHGFHIHEFGDLSRGCESAGAHYNPDGVAHGDLERGHVGDLGNITADQSGRAEFAIVAQRVNLTGDQSVVGRAIVVHSKQDDLGKGGNAESRKSGNAGDRLACGVITLKATVNEAATPAQQAAIAISMKQAGIKPKVKENLRPGESIPAKSIIQGYTVFFDPATRVVSVTRGGVDADAAIEQEQISKPTMLAFNSVVYRMIAKIEDETDPVLNEGIPFDQCPGCGGPIVHVTMLREKQDACYHKVKSRYKVWPSAYASGALVQCRKKGAANWGNKGK